MRRFNVLSGELPVQQDRPGYAWRGRRGLAHEHDLRWFGASIYELPEGQWTFPYHYHHGVEEWVYVVAGSPTLRDPSGERALADRGISSASRAARTAPTRSADRGGW